MGSIDGQQVTRKYLEEKEGVVRDGDKRDMAGE